MGSSRFESKRKDKSRKNDEMKEERSFLLFRFSFLPFDNKLIIEQPSAMRYAAPTIAITAEI